MQVSKKAHESNKCALTIEIGCVKVDPHNLVFIDESGLNLGMTRLYGRASRGQRLYDSCPRNRGQNTSLIGALSLDGLIATMSISGSVNTDVFLTYIQEVLLPQLWVGAVVIMDNLPVPERAKHPRGD